ncbi:hypothetical protein ACOMHN_056684 [Nucella lapillus]
MAKRANIKLAMSFRVLKVRSRFTGVMVGLTLTAFFYMDILLCCGDVESNLGPLPPRSSSTSRPSSIGRSTSSMRQARLTEDSAIRRASSADLDPRSTTAGDFNAKIGSDNKGYEEIMGQQGLGEINDSGQRFADLCAMSNNLVFGGSFFHHGRIHKATWVSPDLSTRDNSCFFPYTRVISVEWLH